MTFNLPIVMVDGMEDDDAFTKPLGRQAVFYYGVGHMLNDITSACWFTYLLVFLTDIGLPSRYISYYMLRILSDYNTFMMYFSFKI